MHSVPQISLKTHSGQDEEACGILKRVTAKSNVTRLSKIKCKEKKLVPSNPTLVSDIVFEFLTGHSDHYCPLDNSILKQKVLTHRGMYLSVCAHGNVLSCSFSFYHDHTSLHELHHAKNYRQRNTINTSCGWLTTISVPLIPVCLLWSNLDLLPEDGVSSALNGMLVLVIL